MSNTTHESTQPLRAGQPGATTVSPLARWRSIDLVSTAVIGVVFGVAYWGWSSAYTALSTPVAVFIEMHQLAGH